MAEPVLAPVLFVSATAEVSGAEVVLLDLATFAVGQGRQVVVACPPGPLVARLPVGATHLAMPALRLGGGPAPLRPLALALRSAGAVRALRRGLTDLGDVGARPRVVVNSLLALPAAALLRPPDGVSWLVHDTVHRRDQRLVARAARGVVRRAVAVSRATAAPLRDLGLEVVVAHNGVRWPVDAAPEALSAPPVVGMLALLTHWKGHLVLLDAVAGLPGVRLELGGGSFPTDAGNVATIRERAARPDLSGRVELLGHVDALDRLQRWDVAVSASTSPEAGPISVLEAMSVGLSVVGTDHGGTSEFLADGCGVLVPPGDAPALAAALRRVLADAELRADLGRAARARVAAEHDRSRTLPAMLDALLT